MVCGLGEIGFPIFKLISLKVPTQAFDINSKLIPKNNNRFDNFSTKFLHICITFNGKFLNEVKHLKKKFSPKGIVIHSTIKPKTTEKLQKKLNIPIIYSATRGVHKRMLKDLKKYSKCYSIYDCAQNSKWAQKTFVLLMKKAGVKTKKVSSPLTLELAKIVCDTSYYGWLINYAQISNMIALKYEVDYEEMWSFSDEIHQFLGNRPKLFPGYIGGHCVIPNLDLIDENSLAMVKEINDLHLKKVKNAKSIYKKYDKGKQSHQLK